MFDLVHGDSAGRFATRFLTPLRQAQGFFDEGRDGGKFGDEGESAILIDGDDDGDDVAFEVFGFVIVLFDKVHDGKAMLTKSWTDRGSGGSFAGWKSKFDKGFDFFGSHFISF